MYLLSNLFYVCYACIYFVLHIYSKNLYSVDFVSNGEFNYLRSRGYTHPLSILQIRTNARNKYSRMPQSVMLNMISPRGNSSICNIVYSSE